MPNYRRAWHTGGTWFFTVNLLHRGANDLLVRHIDLLRDCVQTVKRAHGFHIYAWTVLPDHLHWILELPGGDTDFALRWRLIKLMFSRALPKTEHRSARRVRAGERGIWQRRFWEHLIRDHQDFAAHMNYVYTNPVKHGLVTAVRDWQQSTFYRGMCAMGFIRQIGQGTRVSRK